MAKKKVVVEGEEEEVAFNCDNCQDSGLQCSVCSPVFEDTFKTEVVEGEVVAG